MGNLEAESGLSRPTGLVAGAPPSSRGRDPARRLSRPAHLCLVRGATRSLSRETDLTRRLTTTDP